MEFDRLVDLFLEANAPEEDAEYKGKKVTLNKPIRTSGGPKKFKVYVKDPKTKNVKIVRFGDPNLSIKRDDPKRLSRRHLQNRKGEVQGRRGRDFIALRKRAARPGGNHFRGKIGDVEQDA